MFKKKNKVTPAPKKNRADKYKFQSLKRIDECSKLHKTYVLAQQLADEQAEREIPTVEINCCKIF